MMFMFLIMAGVSKFELFSIMWMIFNQASVHHSFVFTHGILLFKLNIVSKWPYILAKPMVWRWGYLLFDQ